MLSKFLNYVNDFNNYDVLKFSKLHINNNAPPTNLHSIVTNCKQAPLSVKYQQSSPRFEDSSKTAFAVSNSNMANADTGATGSYIATRDTKCL
jgi:N-acetylglutamate synthase/N-acetylornithine aminotransferase